MKTLLQIQSSIYSDGGQSSLLAKRFVAAWRKSNPGGTVIVRDPAKEPVPHLDAAGCMPAPRATRKRAMSGNSLRSWE